MVNYKEKSKKWIAFTLILLLVGAAGAALLGGCGSSTADPLPPGSEEPGVPQPENPADDPAQGGDEVTDPSQGMGETPDSSQGTGTATDPVQGADPGQGKNPGQGSAPVPDPPKQDPSKYEIYAGQLLRIPASAGGESKVIESGITSASGIKQIALTFDAGWLYDQTLDLLGVLDDYQVKATFFLRGYWAKDHPELVKEIAARGHSVQNHSLTHGHMKEMADEAVRNELKETTEIIGKIVGTKPYLFRPPFGEYDGRMLKILAEQGYPYTVKWTVDSLDWAEEMNGVKITEQYLIDRILGNASDKGIVLMHVGGYQTVKALPEIIEGLRKDGYQIVKVDDMLPASGPAKEDFLYTVVKGDTLAGIARKYGTTVDELLEANHMGQ